MRVAVVIPVFNHARYIGEALESCLAQTRKPDRIIAIDDGSKDDSLAVMEPFKARGVEVRGRENRGAHNTINELVAEAARDCEWISILNSDDRYLPRRFEKCLEAAGTNPGKSVISTRLEVIDEAGQRMKEDEPRARWFYGVQSLGDAADLSPAEWLGRGNFIATTSNVFCRADYLMANPFRPYRFNHDYFFLAGAAWRDQIALSHEVLMQYRVHGSNTISTKPEPLIREMLRMHLDLFHHFAAELAADAAMRRRFYDYMRALWDSMSSFHAGMFQVALAQLVARVPEGELQALAASLQGPEFESSPNRVFSGAYDGTEPLSVNVLSRKLDALREDKARLQDDREALQELLKLRQQLGGSRWVGLGTALGLGRTLRKSDGKSASEKLGRLKAACTASQWLKLGAMLGSQSAKDLTGPPV
ncbi:MAG: glycosyltransferase family 2 protein [Verrucomicrobiaceae bacterium]|nr:glycosyltransferase family 2 protein [Verrucomicrobiaceae bacterium]